MSGFKQAYIQAETWAGLENAIKKYLHRHDAENLVKSLETVKKLTGIDMRQDFLLGMLKSMLANDLI